MSRSYRKNVFGSWVNNHSMKGWRTQENRRLRHNAKQLINNCEDYDKLVIPILNDYDTLWGSPQDGRKHPWDVPLVNQCEWDEHRYNNRFGPRPWRKLFKDGHLKPCGCYHNKRGGLYWKMRRK